MVNVLEFTKVLFTNLNLKGHLNVKYAINSKFFKKDNTQYIISGSEDGQIFFWNVQTTEIAYKIDAFTGNLFL